ncbi:MAG: hypothetical protein LBE89_02120 [Helicobacteraceae bacterium]|jgi:hypothetical protein|nr:hypothetical protein [Helicobacteraceae bacterium]
MSAQLDLKVKKSVLEAIEAFLDKGVHQSVIVEYTVKKDSSITSKIAVVEDGIRYFNDGGFLENGLKSFVKRTKTAGDKHGYVLFETARLGGALGVIASDFENIESDLSHKVT